MWSFVRCEGYISLDSPHTFQTEHGVPGICVYVIFAQPGDVGDTVSAGI